MKIYVITESQKEYLVANHKPSAEFDEKYGTTLSQKYQFPFGMTDDMVWYYFFKCKVESPGTWDDFRSPNRFRNTPDVYCKTWNKIVNALTSEYFPYDGVESLDFNIKSDILRGMSSQFNVDDIIHFSINGVYGYNNMDIENEINRTFPKSVTDSIHWVVSKPTLEKMKIQIKDRKLNTRDYV